MFANSPASCAQLILLQNVRSGPGSPIAFALAKNALGGRMRNANGETERTDAALEASGFKKTYLGVLSLSEIQSG
jgi:hypothetical protein